MHIPDEKKKKTFYFHPYLPGITSGSIQITFEAIGLEKFITPI